jgi:hypothetical protein
MEDYVVTEIQSIEPGQPKYEITAPLEHKLMEKALIAVGPIRSLGDMQFVLINDRPCIKFRISNPVGSNVYPKISQAEDFLMRSTNEA